MLHPNAEPEASRAAAEIEAARRTQLCPSERADAITFDWSRIGFGIVLAGGAYPVVLGAISAIVGAATLAWDFLAGGSDGAGIDTVGTGAVILAIYAIGGALVGVAWSGFVTALTLPLIYVIAWSLNLRAGIVWLGAFSGGLIGFISVLPLTLSLRSVDFRTEPWLLVAAAAIGPGLTTILGQLGGAWGGTKSRELGDAQDWERQFLVATLDRNVDAAPRSTAASEQPHQPPQPRIQFGIRHLLWVAVWLSLLLSLIRLCGIPYEFILPLLLGWLLFQLATLALGRRLFRRLVPWWAARRLARST